MRRLIAVTRTRNVRAASVPVKDCSHIATIELNRLRHLLKQCAITTCRFILEYNFRVMVDFTLFVLTESGRNSLQCTCLTL